MTQQFAQQIRPPRPWPMFGGLLVGLLFLLGAVFSSHFYADYRTERTRFEANESLNVELARRAVATDIAAVTTDLMFLRQLAQRLDFSPGLAVVRREYLGEVFAAFAREKRLYDQIRFLDEFGREVVRVNMDKGRGHMVAPDNLQDKSGRYYVKQALQLIPGGIYLSPFDLNVEDGRVETPIKPMLRFATPVFDAQDRLQGLVVLNYLGTRILENFRHAAANIADHVHLLNEAGFWLSSPRPGQAWGFMFGREDTFGTHFPAAWRRIAGAERGQFRNADGQFTFATLRPAAESARVLTPGVATHAPGDAWKVVAHRQEAASILGLRDFAARNGVLYLGILALLTLLAYLLASANAHRRSAEGQHAYEQRFRQTLEDIGLVALMVDLHGHLTFCNHYLLDLTGWRREEVIGKNWVDRFVPDEQRGGVRKIIDLLGRMKDFPPEFEGEICTRDGGRRLISWNNALARDADGRVVGLTAIGEDITDRRSAEEQVRRLSRAVEQSRTIVVITDRGGRIEYVNPMFTAVTGYTFEEVRGRNPRLLNSGETPREEYARLWQVLGSGGEWRGEFHNRRKDGSLYWESALISAVRDADGDITNYLAVKEDITERKRLEQEVEQRNLELARAQALAAMGQMASMLAHDLRNPLSSVKMAVQILGKQASSREALELVEISQEQTRYMEDIITDMLTYSRPGELHMTWLSADKLVAGVLETVRRRILESGVAVEVACAAGLPTFPGDASKLRQLLSNLLVNAVQATAVSEEGDRHVVVLVEHLIDQEGSWMRFQVCDNGEGIDRAIAQRLFEPFFTTRAKGTGLGLAIVHQITELHGGRIRMEPGQPDGTCATVVLPMTPAGTLLQAEPATGTGDPH